MRNDWQMAKYHEVIQAPFFFCCCCDAHWKGKVILKNHTEEIPNVRSNLKSKIIPFTGTAFCLSFVWTSPVRSPGLLFPLSTHLIALEGNSGSSPGLKRCLSERHWIEMNCHASAINAGPQRSVASLWLGFVWRGLNGSHMMSGGELGKGRGFSLAAHQRRDTAGHKSARIHFQTLLLFFCWM